MDPSIAASASLAEESGDDTDQMLHVVRMMVAVSLHNRQIDLSNVDVDDAEKEQIKTRLETLVEEGRKAAAARRSELEAQLEQAESKNKELKSLSNKYVNLL